MSEFHDYGNTKITSVPLKMECGCPSGGGTKNGHIRYPSYGGMQKKTKTTADDVPLGILHACWPRTLRGSRGRRRKGWRLEAWPEACCRTSVDSASGLVSYLRQGSFRILSITFPDFLSPEQNMAFHTIEYTQFIQDFKHKIPWLSPDQNWLFRQLNIPSSFRILSIKFHRHSPTFLWPKYGFPDNWIYPVHSGL